MRKIISPFQYWLVSVVCAGLLIVGAVSCSNPTSVQIGSNDLSTIDPLEPEGLIASDSESEDFVSLSNSITNRETKDENNTETLRLMGLSYPATVNTPIQLDGSGYTLTVRTLVHWRTSQTTVVTVEERRTPNNNARMVPVYVFFSPSPNIRIIATSPVTQPANSQEEENPFRTDDNGEIQAEFAFQNIDFTEPAIGEITISMVYNDADADDRSPLAIEKLIRIKYEPPTPPPDEDPNDCSGCSTGCGCCYPCNLFGRRIWDDA